MGEAQARGVGVLIHGGRQQFPHPHVELRQDGLEQGVGPRLVMGGSVIFTTRPSSQRVLPQPMVAMPVPSRHGPISLDGSRLAQLS
ncbi:hypothetical protein [Roseomonas marmotae]|uniref:M23 family metallopeptidase n=1 Tax=Roseomonas marmotae TaxID=2768161 RepID=A0ABS3KHP2_9PROT|nr:hypothetical protein [Roseomonas marmotae]MBO1076517.1 hypothetical protein [Roseomonas marmotae]QTI81865.1 hypothetical protein IAI58_21200 [Roseomonas marmotae]